MIHQVVASISDSSFTRLLGPCIADADECKRCERRVMTYWLHWTRTPLASFCSGFVVLVQ